MRHVQTVVSPLFLEASIQPCGFLVVGRRLIRFNSIREFVDLETPILMFNKNGKYVVMRLQQVCFPRYDSG